MAFEPYPVGGDLVRAWPSDRIHAAIDAADIGIRAALSYGNMELALTLISRKTGLRVCAGEIKVSLKPHR